MSLVVNGVIIPEDEANALTINGADATDFFVNGVKVFDQLLFSAIWSNSTLVSGTHGLEMSGSLFRGKSDANVGPWITANTNGTFVSGTTHGNAGFSVAVAAGGAQSSTANGLECGNTGFLAGDLNWNATSILTFTIAGGFTGTSDSAAGHILQTSGGAMRYYADPTGAPWATLT